MGAIYDELVAEQNARFEADKDKTGLAGAYARLAMKFPLELLQNWQEAEIKRGTEAEDQLEAVARVVSTLMLQPALATTNPKFAISMLSYSVSMHLAGMLTGENKVMLTATNTDGHERLGTLEGELKRKAEPQG